MDPNAPDKDLQAEMLVVQRLFERAPGFIAILRGPDHVFAYANESYRRLVGERELVGRPVRDALPEVGSQGFLDRLDRVFATGERFAGAEVLVRLVPASDAPPRDAFIDLICEPIRDGKGDVAGVLVEGFDVTTRVRAASDLKESEARFRTLADNIPILCWMADASGQIVWLNSRWYEYTGAATEPRERGGWGAVVDAAVLPKITEQWRHALATGEPFDMVVPIRRADGVYRSFLTRMMPAHGADGAVVRWFGTNTDITEQLRSEQHLKLLVNELNHRVKNTLATVQSIAAQSLRGAADVTAAGDAIESRLMALAAAHDILTRENWEGAELEDLVTRTLSPFQSGRARQLRVEGPAARLSPQPALGLSMALNELATNAVKYGALSVPSGRADVTWGVEDASSGQRLRLVWSEHGGPEVTPPRRRGFGSRMIEQGLAAEMGGRVTLEFKPSGVVCTIEAPLGESPLGGAASPQIVSG